jgi:Flp pilus assembly protein TadG
MSPRFGFITSIRAAARSLLVGPEGIEGAALIEFTLFAPIIMVLILGLTDFGLYIYRMSQVQLAAQAGAQYALQRGAFSAAGIASAVTNSACPSGSCTGFPATISASPAAFQFCGCPSNSGVTQIAAGACTGGLICPSDGSVAGTYVTVQSQGTYDTSLPSVLSASPLLISYSNAPACPGGTNVICASSTVRIQ